MTATHRRARKHAPHPSGRAGLPGRATSHPIARAHRPSWLALDSLACTGPCSIHDPRSRRPPPSATPSPTPTRRSSRQILASAPPGDTATHTRASSHPPTPRPRCTARPAPPVTLERLSWTKPPARAHLLRPPRQPCLPAPPPGGQTHGCPPTLELYSPLAPHNATPLPRTRATPTACHRGTTPHAFTPDAASSPPLAATPLPTAPNAATDFNPPSPATASYGPATVAKASPNTAKLPPGDSGNSLDPQSRTFNRVMPSRSSRNSNPNYASLAGRAALATSYP